MIPIVEDAVASKIKAEKMAFALAVKAIIAAVREDEKTCEEALKQMFSSLFPEVEKDKEDALQRAKLAHESMPSVLYAFPKPGVVQDATIPPIPEGIKLKPGVNFGKKKV